MKGTWHGNLRFYNLSCSGACGGGGRRSQIDFHLGGAHASQEVAIVGGYHSLAVGQDTAGPAAAQTTARMGDDGPGFA